MRNPMDPQMRTKFDLATEVQPTKFNFVFLDFLFPTICSAIMFIFL